MGQVWGGSVDSTGMLRFTKHVIHLMSWSSHPSTLPQAGSNPEPLTGPFPPPLRRRHSELQRTQFVTDREITWHGEQPGTPDWSDTSRLVAFSLGDFKGGGVYVAFNTGGGSGGISRGGGIYRGGA